MLIEVGKSELIAMVKGSYPSYEHMELPLVKRCGSYTGGFRDCWDWSYYSLSELTDTELHDLYEQLHTPIPSVIQISVPREYGYKKGTVMIHNGVHRVCARDTDSGPEHGPWT